MDPIVDLKKELKKIVKGKKKKDPETKDEKELKKIVKGKKKDPEREKKLLIEERSKECNENEEFYFEKNACIPKCAKGQTRDKKGECEEFAFKIDYTFTSKILLPEDFEEKFIEHCKSPNIWCKFKLGEKESNVMVVGNVSIYDDLEILLVKNMQQFEEKGLKSYTITNKILNPYGECAYYENYKCATRGNFEPYPEEKKQKAPTASALKKLYEKKVYGKLDKMIAKVN